MKQKNIHNGHIIETEKNQKLNDQIEGKAFIF